MRIIRAIVMGLALCLANPVVAGPYEDGLAAYKRKDYVTALKLWRPLAEQGYSGPQISLGFMYAKGQGVRQNYTKAVKWYRKAAERGYPVAQSNLAGMYVEGQGVPQNYVRAHMWLNLAAAKGDALAQKSRDRVARKMTRAQLAKAQRLALECLRKKYKGC